MQQVKIFKSIESDAQAMEDEVNSWIRQSGAKILQISGNIAPQSSSPNPKAGGLGTSAYAPSDVLLFVLYTTDA